MVLVPLDGAVTSDPLTQGSSPVRVWAIASLGFSCLTLESGIEFA